MKIFSLFKKRKTEIHLKSPDAILRLTYAYIPEVYKDNTSFVESEEYFRNREWGLALKCLVEMAYESGHYFPEDFWSDLATCADKMEMTEDAEFCRTQMHRMETETDQTLPRGWTVAMADDNVSMIHVAQLLTDEWDSKRRMKDGFGRLIQEDGFHYRSYGRYGMIYYVDGGKVLEIAYEMSGVSRYDILINWDNLKAWTIPYNKVIEQSALSAIREELLTWLKGKRLRSDLD